MDPISFSFTGHIQEYTVPLDGVYTIAAYGAQGGNETFGRNQSAFGGLGAKVGGNFSLQGREQLLVFVGQQGAQGAFGGGGGGGGTFVFVDVDHDGTISSADTVLLAAGGGAGAGYVNNGKGGYSADDGSGNGSGGPAGSGSYYFGGGGAGVRGPGGGDGSAFFSGSGAPSITGRGASMSGGAGGYGGGGGAGINAGGGGGGYSGGAGGSRAGSGGDPAGAGRSYIDNTATGRSSTGGFQTGDGFAEIFCFAAGTRLRTARGEVAVEALQVGDIAITATRVARPIMWIGHRDIDCRERLDWRPVRVAANSFGENRPTRDLYLSPGHPILVGCDDDGEGGHLVPIMCLINGTTICRASVDAVTYWHVELEVHDILLAEDLPAESYFDRGSRPWFNGDDRALYDPDSAEPCLPSRCRPVAVDGPVVIAERRRLDAVFACRLADAAAWPNGEEPVFGT